LVFDLGRGDDLVGITEWCVRPAAGVAGVEKVGGTKTPRVERIVELAPDLVLMNREENRREDAEALTGAGLSCHVTDPRDVAQTAAVVRSVGAVLKRAAPAEEIAREIERRAERARSEAAAAAQVDFAYLIWRKPWMAAGRDTYAHALLAQAGGFNVFAGRSERYPEIDPVALGAAAPRLVLLGTEPFPFQRGHAAELAAASGLPLAGFRIADGELLSWHGSRTPKGIDYAARLVAEARRTA
jgi:ABC-type Fe3+-hydroxamate transport system substrate-binding protein